LGSFARRAKAFSMRFTSGVTFTLSWTLGRLDRLQDFEESSRLDDVGALESHEVE
jgi:hypothetical protein